MNDAAIMSIVSLVVAVGGATLAVINHKRIRSTCCGRVFSASVDVEDTTPPILKIVIPDTKLDITK